MEEALAMMQDLQVQAQHPWETVQESLSPWDAIGYPDPERTISIAPPPLIFKAGDHLRKFAYPTGGSRGGVLHIDDKPQDAMKRARICWGTISRMISGEIGHTRSRTVAMVYHDLYTLEGKTLFQDMVTQFVVDNFRSSYLVRLHPFDLSIHRR